MAVVDVDAVLDEAEAFVEAAEANGSGWARDGAALVSELAGLVGEYRYRLALASQ